MQDGPRTAEAQTAVRPAVAVEPANPDLAGKARGELGEKARAQGNRFFGWAEIRKGDIADWLKDPDGANPQDKGGWLRQKDNTGDGWKNDKPTEEYLANAQRRARELAVEGVGKISADLEIPSNQLADKSIQDIYDVAEAKGWNVKEGDPKRDETRDYLRNAYEYAREQQQAATPENQAVVKTAAGGIEDPDKARGALELIKGSLTRVETEKGFRLVFKLEKAIATLKNSDNPLNKALGFDFEIAVVQRKLAETNGAIEVALKQGKIDQVEAQEVRKKFQDQLDKLQKERGDIVDKDGNPIPAESQVSKLAEKFAEGEEEKTEAKENPLGLMERKFNAAVKSKEGRQKLTDALQSLKQGMSEEEQNMIDEIAEGIQGEINGTMSQEKREKLKKVGSKAITIGGGACILMLLMAWIASKEKQGQGMG